MTKSNQRDKRDIENVVQEIMRAVDYYNGATNWGTTEQQMAARAAIESKLRELVEKSFSVREPLDVQYPENYKNPFACIAYADGWRASYRAHGIINTSGEE